MQKESRYTLKPYEELFFTDDFLFSKIMRNPEIAKGVVQNLLGIKVKKIEFVTSQYSIDELYTGKGIRLDAYLEDEDKVIDIEMQTVIKKDEGLRMRYYQSMIDIDHLNRGESYSDLKESYVVFICLDDPFGDGKPVYNFVTKEIQAEVDSCKNHPKWRAEYMLWKDQICEWKDEAREDGLKEGRVEGEAKGAKNKAIETAKNLFKLNLTTEQIATCTGLSLEEVNKLKK